MEGSAAMALAMELPREERQQEASWQLWLPSAVVTMAVVASMVPAAQADQAAMDLEAQATSTAQEAMEEEALV
jgi:hypothetical protein